MGRVAGKVALITGAGGAMGQCHARRLAEEGADIIALDLGRQLKDVPYEMPVEDDLEKTVMLVQSLGRRAVALRADIRSCDELDAAVATGVEALGAPDIVVANAGIWSMAQATWEIPEDRFVDMIDINLTSQWRTIRSCVPWMLEADKGGSIIFNNSTTGLRAMNGNAHYTAAKHGAIGLMRTLAHELGEHRIRSNAVCPTTVATPMLMHQEMYRLFRPDLEDPTFEDAEEGLRSLHLLPVSAIDPMAVADAVLWLASDESAMLTGVAIPVDAGNMQVGAPWRPPAGS